MGKEKVRVPRAIANLRYPKKYKKGNVEKIWRDILGKVKMANSNEFGQPCPGLPQKLDHEVRGKKFSTVRRECQALRHPKYLETRAEWEQRVVEKFGGGPFKTRLKKDEVRDFVEKDSNKIWSVSFTEPKLHFRAVLGDASYHLHHKKESSKNYSNDFYKGLVGDCKSITPAYVLRNWKNLGKPSVAWKKFKSSCSRTVMLCRFCHSTIHNKHFWGKCDWAKEVDMESEYGKVTILVSQDILPRLQGKAKAKAKSKKKK
tara:strand:+ start:761 stop:1537 length:777 start_codon:yes stop_codon:yes gene_type:complete